MKKVLFILVCMAMCITINAQRKTTNVRKQVKTYKFEDLQGIWLGHIARNSKGEWIDLDAAMSFAFTEYKVSDNKYYCVSAIKDNALRLPYSFNGVNKITLYRPDDHSQILMRLQILELKPKERITLNITLAGDTTPMRVKFLYADIEKENEDF